MTRVLVVIPAYNEGQSVGSVVQWCKEKFSYADILVVNDGSTDDTAEVAQSAGAKVTNLPFNLGIGGAVQTGYIYALQHGYDIVCQIDADGQHDPGDLPELLAPIITGQADYVVGSRFLAPGKGQPSTPLRRIGIKLFSFLLRLLTGDHFTDPTCGFRAANHRVIQLFSHYYPSDYPEVEALVLARRNRIRTVEVPIPGIPRLAGQSSITLTKSFYYMVKVAFAVIIRAIPRRQRSPFHAS